MNFILHQFKTDVAHFRRGMVVLWMSFVAEALVANFNALTGVGIGLSSLLVKGWEAFYAFILIAALVQSDALVGSTAGWLTRPMRRWHLFWAKTAFIVICLFLPRLVIQLIGWTLGGYSLHLDAVAAAESLLFTGALVLVVAVLAALTRDLARFFLAAGIMATGIFAAYLLVEMLVHAGVLKEVHADWPESSQLASSAEAVAWLVVAAGAFAAWILQARLARWQMAVALLAVGFLAMPVITTVWPVNFLAPRLTPSVPLTFSLVGTNQPMVNTPQIQLLSTELAVSGVPDHQVAVVQKLTAKFRFHGDTTNTVVKVSPDGFRGRTRPAEALQRNAYLDAISEFFPTNTIWFKENYFWNLGTEFNNSDIVNRFPKGPPPARLDGSMTVDLFGVKKIAEQPLRPAEFEALPGLWVAIEKVSLAGDVISVELSERATRLMLDRNVDTIGYDGDFGSSSPSCTYVLYHPGSGEAFLMSQNNSYGLFPAVWGGDAFRIINLRFPYSALRERLAGVSAEDWMREARLWVFTSVYAGTSDFSFHEDQYHWHDRGGNSRDQKENLDAAKIIESATLPASPTAEQLGVYLDAILLNIPEGPGKELRHTIEMKLAAIGHGGVPALLRRLPLAADVEQRFIFPVISKLITREQLPDLCAALQRDSDLVEIFLEKNWQADARDVLVAKLPDHRQPMVPEALRIAAEAREPATYADLRWHFVHLKRGHEEVIDALEKCPGFDVPGAVREAWEYARLGVTDAGEFSAVAARQGLPDALNVAVWQVGTTENASVQQNDLAQLAALTGYNGSTNAELPWLTANLGRFRYDPARQRYELNPAQ